MVQFIFQNNSSRLFSWSDWFFKQYQIIHLPLSTFCTLIPNTHATILGSVELSLVTAAGNRDQKVEYGI
jgi:hypothetical protein